MQPRDVLRAAAVLVAKHAWPPIPAALVRWSDEPQVQADGDCPQIVLSEVSQVPEGPTSIRTRVNVAGTLDVRMLQTFIWKVQVKCEGWKLDSDGNNNPALFARRTRFGWHLQAVTRALLDPDSDEDERIPIKMVDEPGQILTLNQKVGGHTLPVLVYEIEFRYVDHDTDPSRVGVIESATLGGTLGGAPATITTES